MKSDMKSALFFCAVILTAMCGSAVTLMPERMEVVVANDAPQITAFAGDELTNFLSKALGRQIPLVTAPSEGRQSIVLGEKALPAAAGMDFSKEPRDTFVISAEGERVYIAGRDGRGLSRNWIYNPKCSYGQLLGHERATLFGVYDFLERYVGVRFYFPDDELGTVVPSKNRVEVPDGVRKVSPDYLLRDPYFGGDGVWPSKSYGGMETKTAYWMRLRLASTSIPCCHGSRELKYIERFGKTHPEYLAQKKDGTVRLDTEQFAAYQYCWSNPGFQEELYQDVKAYLTGQSPATRGLKNWGNGCKYGKWVDIMPEDAFNPCYCKGCQAVYGEAFAKNDPNYASELLWGVTAKIGKRLIKEGVQGNITMMAYSPYRRVPDFEIPSNVWVMVAETGPWSLTNPVDMKNQYDEIRAWRRKIGHKVWIWTYPSKYGELMIKGVPCVGPHAWGRYYADLKDDIIGGFCECESDRAIYNFLNYYVYSRVMWDAATDIDAVLDELYVNLFGKAAPEMKEFFTELEERWTKRVVGNIVNTPLGPKTIRPSNRALWRDIYSKEVRGNLDALLKAGTAKVGGNSLEGRRIALMRAEFYDRMVDGAEDYEAQMRGVESLRFFPEKGSVEVFARSSGLRWFTNVASVATSVAAKRTSDELVFTFDCIEPKMDLVSTAYNKPGDHECWRDNNVEIFLNPSGDGKTMFHYILTSAGNFAGHGYVEGSGQEHDWVGVLKGVRTKAWTTASGWKGEIKIPLSLLGVCKDEFKVNFCRNRVLKNGESEVISWSPYVMRFWDVERFGTIVFGKKR